MSKLVKLAVAAVGGFVAGILLAPKSGKETREELKLKADEAKKKATHKASIFRCQLCDASRRASHFSRPDFRCVKSNYRLYTATSPPFSIKTLLLERLV